ncbi:flagellar basal body P-ring formation chaperone FlgA [Paracoccus shanxieyensis]|uniref:Flagella basal body P-ring formation protein FlgA n=1 Tax=Paracoccus shanxieyensis TaxID=2675752 RepID=A0A6L6IUI3_9RHOB|nr:flagellar basal body P-ring formation chaperone FlgA [Paracoccus shanxieyensis]MTH63271.1 flagellar basal body P-ring formation protein FlgA [Paracoccus shanxieyensis]MTH87185.1 flagellar basal body P-ring formation protein FlgA [Paracoccus shanxieyensis]
MRVVLALLALSAPPAQADSVVATRTLSAGMVILPQDVRMDPGQQGGIGDLDQVVGQQLQVMVAEGRPVQPRHVASPKLVDRNQIVTIIFERGALRIEAEGRAMAAGSVGEMVRVLNNSSRVTVVGRVAPDGSVIVAQN